MKKHCFVFLLLIGSIGLFFTAACEKAPSIPHETIKQEIAHDFKIDKEDVKIIEIKPFENKQDKVEIFAQVKTWSSGTGKYRIIFEKIGGEWKKTGFAYPY